MIVEDFGGAHRVSSDADIDAVLAVRYAQGFNEFWLSRDGHRVPTIAIMANGDLARVHYFPRDDHPGFQSVGPAPGLDPDGGTMFALSPTETPWPRPNRSVIPFSLALAAAKEFAKSPTLPRCIEWFEL
jgi:hypothetical protein